MSSPLKGRVGTVLLTLLGPVATVVVAGLTVVFSGACNVAAKAGHLAPVRWALGTTFHNASALAARRNRAKAPSRGGP